MKRSIIPSTFFATPSIGTVSLVHSGTAHTKGSWTEIIASTSRHANRLLVVNGFASLFRDMLIDIGVGGSGSETTIIENLPLSEFTTINMTMFDFPVSLPSGTRLVARQQATSTSGVARCALYPYYSTMVFGARKVRTYGADTGNSCGTVVDTSGTGGTKGSWVEISSSTSAHHHMWWVSFVGKGESRLSLRFQIDIGVGGSGSESVILPDLTTATYSANDRFNVNTYGPFFIPVPSGTRLSARAANNINASGTARAAEIMLFGV